jgi:hypothetical protein
MSSTGNGITRYSPISKLTMLFCDSSYGPRTTNSCPSQFPAAPVQGEYKIPYSLTVFLHSAFHNRKLNVGVGKDSG